MKIDKPSELKFRQLSQTDKDLIDKLTKGGSGNVSRRDALKLAMVTGVSLTAAEQLLTEGKAVMSTGSPFDPVHYDGRDFPIAQCNNSYIFPAMGLGVRAANARRVSDEMFMVAAIALKEFSPAMKDPQGDLLPPLEDLRKLARHIAIAVAKKAQEQGLADKTSPEDIERRVDEKMWQPSYPTLVRNK